ncbi:response regulator in two-component regulatory system [Alishewanella agri BL06]|uniref:Response regulator in two-component regulatory system n=1 Tax=Alishewanella agri BL06 TaxID=1195246 RepID=I8U908_9ALTE|nr:LytTR family DNA-binding domain-containing protein [Alishewanella agri]EIW88478.1 response regulator in two-component regulatory system [Alishewanella agri BL06]OZB43436.1 MAG: DNA-binding response regulator [Alishewanella sp. 34-51-39]
MKPLRVLIADDEPITSQYLKILLQRFPNLLLVGTTTSGRDTLNFLHQHHLDLIFMDIVMPDISGIDILRQFNKTSSLTPPLFVMLTAYEQFACAAYNFHAFAYLTKPVTPQHLEQVLLDATTLLRPDSPFCNQTKSQLVFQTGNSELIFQEQEIILIEAAGNYLCLHTRHENYIIRNTLKELLAKLPPLFVQVHRSAIVNILHVKQVVTSSSLHLVLSNNRQVKISRRCKLQLDTLLNLAHR